MDRRDTQPDPPLQVRLRQMIHPVMLVPRMAPRTMPMAWRTFIMPELTKPTTITEVAEEDWMMAVTPVPRSTPFMGCAGELVQHQFQLVARYLLQPVPHQGHAKEEEGHPAQQRDEVGQVHGPHAPFSSLFSAGLRGPGV